LSPLSLNEATLHLDLDGLDNVILEFDNAETGDEDTALPATFTGSVNGDGVSFSVDGESWFRLLSFTEGSSLAEFQTTQIDLSAAAATAGVTLGSNTQIKFQQFDNFNAPSDGIFIDNVTVTADVPNVDPDQTAPTVESIVINDGNVQRSMVNTVTINFSEAVNVAAADLILENTSFGSIVTPIVSTQLVGGKTIATLAFSGAGIIAGSLADGNYRLTILDTITDSAGNALDGNGDGSPGGNAVDNFFRLFGDFNGNRTVDPQDSFFFRQKLNQATDDAIFDFNGNGIIDPQDSFFLRRNLNRRLDFD
jgi:hypothetical protein